MAKTFRRSDYLSGACTHREYYAQFVTDYIKTQLVARMPAERWKESTCEHFNDIPLLWWDRNSIIATDADAKFRELGDYPTLAGRVCILKEAARQCREEGTEMPRGAKYKNWETGDMTTPDEDQRLTKAQAEKLADVMTNGFRIVESVVVCEGGCMGLPDGFASVAFEGGYQMGIAPDGRAST